MAVRTYACAYCGHAEDRDVNVAKNIRAKGFVPLGQLGFQPACRAEAAQAAQEGPLGIVAEWTMLKPSYDAGLHGVFNYSE